MDNTQPAVAPAAAGPPADTDIRITDVNRGLWSYLSHRGLPKALLYVALFIAWEALMVWWSVKVIRSDHIVYDASGNPSDSDSTPLGFAGTLGLIGLAAEYGAFATLKDRFERDFLKEFAAANGYTFAKDGTVDETYGTIFRMSDDQAISDLVSGTYAGCDLRMFLHEATIRHGRDSSRYDHTVIELDVHGQLPDLLMVNKHQRLKFMEPDFQELFGIKNIISLEGDFNEHFTLYAPDSMSVEALEVFSPDTMALMEDEARHYTVEFAGNRVYIYAVGYVSTVQDLTGMFALAKQLLAKIEPLSSRLTHDSAVAAPAVGLYKPRLDRRGVVRRTVIIIFILLCLALGVAIAIISPDDSQPGGQTYNSSY